ncbi:MAG: DUF2330 domain-containing protein [Verrucomicrobia bacterium]|nr:DUF2330 domain-containing protein [Verrucomicrobiota bacterium]
MKAIWPAMVLAVLGCLGNSQVVLADGMVYSEPEVREKITIPDQQAMIQFADGVELLVIETSFLGGGTNFAWVVPLPSPPQINPVSETFFSGLQQAFQPRLIHKVHNYYLGVLFVCGLGYLAWRAFKDEVEWINDLPVCVLIAAGVWVFQKNWVFALIVFGFTVYTRMFARSTANLAIVVFVGLMLAGAVTFSGEGFGFMTMNMTLSAADEGQSAETVNIISVQQAGVFESTTISGSNPQAIVEWLTRNGYAVPAVTQSIVGDYLKEGWVFVASKVRRASNDSSRTTLHPLAFRFAARVPVYPMRLTAAARSDCAVDLYVFGDRRARAKNFSTRRCERIQQPDQPVLQGRELRFADAQLLQLIGRSGVGTKLSAKLKPSQMDSDVKIGWCSYRGTGAWVCSNAGALSIALNVTFILAPLCWLVVGASRGGFGVDDSFVWRWRWRLLAISILVGGIIFFLLPKVPVSIGFVP